MTRFARAHGSKSSNERLPEQATSWNVMKQQLQDKLESNEAVSDVNKSVKKIWKSSDFEPDAWNKDNTVWVEFEEESGTTKKTTQQISQKTKKASNKRNTPILNECSSNTIDCQKKSKKRKLEHEDETDKHDLSGHEDKLSSIINTAKTKKKKHNKSANMADYDAVIQQQADIDTVNTSHAFNSARKEKPKNKIGKDNLIGKERTLKKTGGSIMEQNIEKNRKRNHSSTYEIVADQPITKFQSQNQETENKLESSDYTQLENSFEEFKYVGIKKKKSGRGENKMKEVTDSFQVKQHIQEQETEIQEAIDCDAQVRKKKKHKQKHFENSFQGEQNVISNSKNFSQEGAEALKSKNSHIQIEKKIRRPKWQHQNDKILRKHNFAETPIKKKHGNLKKNLHVTILHMNGRDIEIVKFDGFPVKKEDAENLKILKQKLIANGVPSNEIKTTMKLERRKAEKALAREKKKVCFHCRNSGHVLSECPELGKAEMEDASGSGICFKCGSTEHKHFECRVTREQEFRFAKCFVCDEQGHIARQCPDNPRGLYPKGGGCHVCGDVTHLKKDCPDLIKEKEQKTIRLPTLSSKSLEVLEDNRNTATEPTKNRKKKKTIKF